MHYIQLQTFYTGIWVYDAWIWTCSFNTIISNLIFYLNRTHLYVKFIFNFVGINILATKNKYDVFNIFFNPRIKMYIAETRDFVHLTEFISPVDVLPYDWSFYMYDGSLTTPPCSHNVRWIVMRCPIRISAEVEIKAFFIYYQV